MKGLKTNLIRISIVLFMGLPEREIRFAQRGCTVGQTLGQIPLEILRKYLQGIINFLRNIQTRPQGCTGIQGCYCRSVASLGYRTYQENRYLLL